MIEVEIYSRDIKKVSHRLAVAGNPLTIRAEISGGLSAVGVTARMVLAQAARNLPAYHNRHTGLRARIARAAQARTTQTPTGPELVVGIRRELMGNQASLPQHIEVGSWRHPVFGNKTHWVTQVGKKNWFTDAVNLGIVPVVEQSIDKTADRMASSFVSGDTSSD